MKKRWILMLAVGVLVAGCSSGTELSKAEETKMKDALEAGKGEFDINKVPPEMRDQVEKFFGAAEGKADAAPAPK